MGDVRLTSTFSKVGKIYFIIEIQIITGFDHIFGIQFTSKQNTKNDHSKYLEILILMEQHSNCR